MINFFPIYFSKDKVYTPIYLFTPENHEYMAFLSISIWDFTYKKFLSLLSTPEYWAKKLKKYS